MFIALLRQTRRPTLHLLKKPGGVPSKKQRELDPTVLDNLSEGKGLQLEIRDDSKTVVE